MILKENEVLRCPRCGGKTFCATAHVTQDWELDDSGTFVRCLNDCIEVTHEPDREDVWDCKTCGYSDAGEKFVTTVGEDSEIRLCECVYDLSALAAQMLGVHILTGHQGQGRRLHSRAEGQNLHVCPSALSPRRNSAAIVSAASRLMPIASNCW